MNPLKYVRREPDGVHWPDADVDDDLYYGIDFNDCMNIAEGETITNVEWVLTAPVTSSDNYVEDNIIIIKLLTPKIGVFKITAHVTTEILGRSETQVSPMMLTVY